MARNSMWSVVAVFAGTTVGVCPSTMAQTYSGTPRQGERHLATRPPYPERMADDVRRPGANGRHFVSRGFIGDPNGKYEKRWPLAWGDPGPAAYGADEEDSSVAYVRVADTAVSISPWEAVDLAGYQNLERGRQEWLKERGYTGGVRTFTNPVYRRRPADASLASSPRESLPKPRMIIDLPPDMPRFRQRQEVQADPRPRGLEHQPRAVVVVRTNEGKPVGPSPAVAADCRDANARIVVRKSAAQAGESARVSAAVPAPKHTASGARKPGSASPDSGT